MIKKLTLALLLLAAPVFAQTALMPMPYQTFLDSYGNPLSGGKVYTCQPGTSCPGTLKYTYQDAAGITLNTDPVVLDSAGRAAIWLSGFYKVAVYSSTGVLQRVTDNVSSTDSIPAGSPTPSYTIGQTLGFTNLSTAKVILAGQPATVYVPQGTATNTLTIPASMEIVPLNGAVITVNSGKTLTIYSTTARWPLTQIFAGPGGVQGLTTARPEWFGAKGDGVADDSGPIMQALASLTQPQAVLRLGPKTYKSGTYLHIERSNLTIVGCGKQSVISSINTGYARQALLEINANPEMATGTHRQSNITLKDFALDMSAVNPVVYDPGASAATGYYLWFGALTVNQCDHVTIDNVTMTDVALAGLTVRHCYDVSVTNCTVDRLNGYIVSDATGTLDGNCFNFLAYFYNDSTYTGRLGHYKVSNCTAIGAPVSAWPPASLDPTYGHHLMTGQVGFCFQTHTGATLSTQRIDPCSISNCTAESLGYGYLVEALFAGGTGEVIVNGNSAKNCIKGIVTILDTLSLGTLPGGSPLRGSDIIISNNRVTNSYGEALSINTERTLVSGNIITDFSLATNSGVNSIFNSYYAGVNGSAIMVFAAPNNTYIGDYYGVVLTGNVISLTSAHTSSNLRAVGGIYATTNQYGVNLHDFRITNNSIDLAKSTYQTGPGASGMWIAGNFFSPVVQGNTITGTPCHGVVFDDVLSSASYSARNIVVDSNLIYDIGNASDGTGVSITSLYGFCDVTNNKIRDTRGGASKLAMGVVYDLGVPNGTSGVNVTGNYTSGLKSATGFYDISVTAGAAHIADNAPFNFRDLPSNTAPSGNFFRGMYVRNYQPAVGSPKGWVYNGSVWVSEGNL